MTCNLYCSFTNSEEALALAIEQLLGYGVNVSITENHIHLGYDEPVSTIIIHLRSVFLIGLRYIIYVLAQ